MNDRDQQARENPRRQCAVAQFVTAYFLTRGTRCGYVLRIGVVWFGGLMSLWQCWPDSTEWTPPSAEVVASMLGRNSVLGAALAACLFGIFRRAEEHRRSMITERAKEPPAGHSRRSTWTWKWLCACLAFAATLISGDHANLMFGDTDHDAVFYVVVGIAFLFVCLAMLFYFRTNSRKRTADDQRPSRQ